MTPPLGPIPVPCISFTECPSQPDPGDSGDGDYDEGPEYLAIGNLGSRRVSRSSTHSSDQSEPREPPQQQGARILPPNRRSSFSEGQKGPGRGLRGHTRSFSDTGISTKLRSGKLTPMCLESPASCCSVCINALAFASDLTERHMIVFCLCLCGILFGRTIAFGFQFAVISFSCNLSNIA